MTQYIPLDALVANIKRLKNHYDSAAKEFGDEGYKDNVLMEQSKSTVCERVLSIIKTLEVKEVDLEKEINFEYTPFEGLPFEVYSKIAKHFFELGIKAQKGE